MAEAKITSPRRPGCVIYCHAADITLVVCQEDVLQSFSDDELSKMAFAISTEQQARGEKDAVRDNQEDQ